MRVPNISLYKNSTYQLGSLTSEMQNLNEVMATQRRINNLSDDPIGLSQALNLKSTLGNLEQIERNVDMGISWLEGGETALDSVTDLILDVKTQVSRLINASMSSQEREDAVESINGMVEQIVALGNTQVNGSYIFAGTDNSTKPFEYLAQENPPRVAYYGDQTPFAITTDEAVTVDVGRNGRDTFWDDTVEINATNNTILFTEDNGHGDASEITLEAVIDDGTYTAFEIETAIRNALNASSAEDGYGVTYAVTYNEDDQTFSIREDGSYDGYIRTQFKWDTINEPYINDIAASPGMDAEQIDIEILSPGVLTIDTSAPIRLTWQGNNTWALDNNPGYTILHSGTLSGTH